jgi:hypothetical protein
VQQFNIVAQTNETIQLRTPDITALEAQPERAEKWNQHDAEDGDKRRHHQSQPQSSLIIEPQPLKSGL